MICGRSIPCHSSFSLTQLTQLTQLVGAGAAFLVATLRTGDPVPDVLGASWSGGRALRIDLAGLYRPGADALKQDVLRWPGRCLFTLAGFCLAGREIHCTCGNSCSARSCEDALRVATWLGRDRHSRSQPPPRACRPAVPFMITWSE